MHLFVPPALAVAMAIYPGIPLNPRYFLVSLVPYWIFLALGVSACLKRSLYVIPAAAALVIGVSLWNYFYQPSYAKQDVRSAVALVSRQAKPGDVIIISSVELGGPFHYYFKRRDIPFYGYPAKAGFVDDRQLPKDARRLTSGRRRAWLILGRTWSSDPKGLIPRWFSSRFPLKIRRTYPGVLVRCYNIPGSSPVQ
jgi:hypothetical protein